ncbi:MAG: hypothetical protein AB1416_13020 [Actinomycetota bacterium]
MTAARDGEVAPLGPPDFAAFVAARERFLAARRGESVVARLEAAWRL